jgi:hypothetical protein
LQLRPQQTDQGVLLRMVQFAEIGQSLHGDGLSGLQLLGRGGE